MMFLTHLVFGLFIGSLIIKHNFLNINNNVLFLIIISLSSIIPDIDIATSWISKKTKSVTYFISYFFRHRGVLHSILTPILIFIIVYAINTEIALAFLLGYSSHIILDSLTKEGTQPLLPITKYTIKGLIKTRSLMDFLILIILIILTIIIII